MSTDAWKTAFWQLVGDCLAEFHGRPAAQARMDALMLRARIEDAPAGIDPDMVYHAEPFDLATRLAGVEMDLGPHRRRYEALRHIRFAATADDMVLIERPRIHPRRARG